MLDGACDTCLARSWLLARIAGHLESVRAQIEALLCLDAEALIDAVAGSRRKEIREEFEGFDPAQARAAASGAGLELICRCDSSYPAGLLALESPPAVLHICGSRARLESLTSEQTVALVGARRASPYGADVARSLARSLDVTGLTIVSGMALGIDSAAHAGALSAGGRTIAVLPAGAERPYPPSRSSMHRQLREVGAIVSELPPGTGVWRWMFPARNRIIAALSAMTIVIEATGRSGALVTARVARALGRLVGAVPGRITTPQAEGPHALLASGARLVRGPQDVLDALFSDRAPSAPIDARDQLPANMQDLLDAIAAGRDTLSALDGGEHAAGADALLASLASLELSGHIRREPGGRFSVLP